MEEQEQVCFFVPDKRYMVQIKEQKYRVGEDGVVRTIPAKVIRFDLSGRYVTSNPEEVKLLKETQAYKSGFMSIATMQDMEAVEAVSPKQKTTRGVLTTKERYDQETQASAQLKEKNKTKCGICGEEFEDDFARKKLNMHMISVHRTSLKNHEKKKGSGTKVKEK